MKLSVRLFLLLTILVMALSPAFAAVFYVSPNGNNGNSGTEWALAKQTIQAGLNAASPGDEVWVAVGTYTGAVALRNDVSLYGGFNGTETDRSQRNWQANRTIITNTAGDVVTGANGALIDGFVIRGGANGIACNSTSPTITNNIISGAASYGITNTGSPTVTNNIIFGNTVYGIRSSAGSPKFVNNTIVGNGYGINLSIGGTPVIANNIIAFNNVGIARNAGTPSLSCNNVYGNRNGNYSGITAGTGDISADPMFTSLEFGDLHIQSGSPCRDAVTEAVPGFPALTVDMDGEIRPEGNYLDIGADEFSDHTFTPRTVYVDGTVASSGDGTTWATAYKTIQEAIDSTLVKGGADIYVAKGVYLEQVKLRPFAHLHGGYDAATGLQDTKNNITIIDAGSTLSGNNVVTASNLSTVEGFTLRGGYCGVYCSYASPTIKNNVITLNSTQGILCRDTSYPVIDGNRIISNGTSGIAVNHTSPTIVNNIIVGHTTGIDITNSSVPTLINNTIVGNGTGISTGSAVVAIANNIVAYNTTGVSRGGTATPTFHNNNVYGNVTNYYPASTTEMPRDTDISLDPLFIKHDYGDFHIKPDSPCRNAGTMSVPGFPTSDIDGQLRYEGDGIDIGADESYGEDDYQERVVYVKGSAAAGGDGTSWNKAYRTIREGIEDTLSRGGAQIWVATGTYVEQVNMKPFAHIYGGYAGDGTTRDASVYVTTIDPGSFSVPAVVGASLARIDGFTIKGGSSGINCSSGAPVINNNIITGSTTYGIYCANSNSPEITNNKLLGTGSAGIYVLSSSSPIIEDNTIADNTTGTGIVFGASSSGTASRNVISGNNAGVSSDSSSPKITSNLIVGNTLTGVSCSNSSTAAVINNTIVANGTGFQSSSSSGAKFYNNIVAYNSTGVSIPSGLPAVYSNNVYGNTTTNYSGVTVPPTNGNISVDPQFASTEYGNFHIQATSPCRDAGDPTAPFLPSKDFEGHDRPEGLAVDIGADESYGEIYDSPYVPRRIYVMQSASSGGDGETWTTAYRTIKEALDRAAAGSEGAEIWVAQGTYIETVKLRRFTHLFGGFNGNETDINQRVKGKYIATIQGTGSGNVVTGSNLSTIDGFTITNGNYGIDCTSSSPTISNNVIKGNNNGINCSNSFPVIDTNVISGNTNTGINCSNSSPTIINNAISGGTKGINCSGSSPLITRNTISANSTYGIDCQSSSTPKIVNNLIIVNGTAVNSSSSSPVLTNNTIACNNSAGFLASSSNAAKAYNNILAYNAVGVSVTGASPSLSHNNVYGNTVDYSGTSRGTSDISDDPVFVSKDYGNFHIRSTSSCRDAGDPTAPNIQELDLDGDPRIIGSAVDIGAYEFSVDEYPDPYVANIVYVDTNRPTSGNGTSWDEAYRTIQEGLDHTLTNGGAEIWVAQGTYAERIAMKPFAHLFGGFNAGAANRADRDPEINVTTIDAGNTSGNTVQAVSFATIDGFTINRGAYGINCTQASPTIANNKITGNTVGIYCSGSAAVITNTTITGAYQYGIDCRNNSAPTITNCIISGRSTGIYSSSSSPIITNNTLNACTTGLSFSSSAAAQVSNNIVAFGTMGIYVGGGSTQPTLTNNCVYGNTGNNYVPTSMNHPSDINVDPKFVDHLAFNFRLQESSPCVDGGYDSAPGMPEYDMDGKARVQGAHVDIGAYELPGTTVEPVEIGAAKKIKNGDPVAINTGVVTAVFGEFFYIEKTDRSCGILVKKAGHALETGWTADVEGTMATDATTSERYINATKAERMGTTTTSIKPVAMNNALLGGGDFGDPAAGLGQYGVENGFGLNNIGLLVMAYGKVTADTATTFFITDGSGLPVKVKVPADVTVPDPDSYVSVIGISTCEGANRSRLLRVRQGSDIAVLKPAQEPLQASLIETKKMGDGALVTLPALLVSRVFGNHFYVQTDDRDCGIMVMRNGSDPVDIDTKVTVTGTLTTDPNTGERYIQASAHPLYPSSGVSVKPLAMTNRSLGGGDMKDSSTGAGQSGVKDGAGLNTIGLLVRACGYVTADGSGSYFLEDGSGVPVRLLPSAGVTLSDGSYIAVTGASSCWKDTSGNILRQIKIALPTDVQEIPVP